MYKIIENIIKLIRKDVIRKFNDENIKKENYFINFLQIEILLMNDD
jgi:hypothetical protein